MARVSFSALIEEIVGKLAGSVFQDSYQGFQIRTRVTPRNPQTHYQQLRRGEFGFISASWRSLSEVARQTFIDAALSPSGGLNLFIQANINLGLIDLPMITSYVTSTAPAVMDLEIVALDGITFTVQAPGSTSVVPAGTSLILFATAEKLTTKIFTNPSQFSPIVVFPAGTDLSTPVDVASDWIARYGQFTTEKRICIKSALIDITNGNRTEAAVSCANSTEIEMFVRKFTAVNQVDVTSATPVSAYTYSLPANTVVANGDSIFIECGGTFDSGSATAEAAIRINGAFAAGPYDLPLTNADGNWRISAILTRDGTTSGWYVQTGLRNDAAGKVFAEGAGGLNFAADQDIELRLKCATGGEITAYFMFVNYQSI